MKFSLCDLRKICTLDLPDEVSFDEEQLESIIMGLEKGLDVTIYAKPEFDCCQMDEIRKGLESGVDVSVYAKPEFDRLQMHQIRLRPEFIEYLI